MKYVCSVELILCQLHTVHPPEIVQPVSFFLLCPPSVFILYRKSQEVRLGFRKCDPCHHFTCLPLLELSSFIKKFFLTKQKRKKDHKHVSKHIYANWPPYYPQYHGCHFPNVNIVILPWLLSERNKKWHWNTIIPVCGLLKCTQNTHLVDDPTAKALTKNLYLIASVQLLLKELILKKIVKYFILKTNKFIEVLTQRLKVASL